MTTENSQARLWPEFEKTVAEKRPMGSFGERMQREREMRRITLDEIAESTKISTRHLRALEEENFNRLPGGIFNKGFVRAYSKFVGIDEEQAVADFLAAEIDDQNRKNGVSSDQTSLFVVQPTGKSLPLEARTRPIPLEAEKPERDHAAGFLYLLVILVFVLGIGGFTYKYWGSRKAEATTGQQLAAKDSAPVVAPPAVSPIPESLRVAKAVENPTQSVVQKSPESKALATQPDQLKIAENKIVGPVRSATESDSSVSNLVVSTAKEGNDTLRADAKINVHLVARQESWIQIKADGNVVMEGMVVANTSKSFAAEKELKVKLGNAAAIDLTYNGKPLPPFAVDAKTKSLTFKADGFSNR